MTWISVDNCGDVHDHSSAQEAKAEAERLLDDHRDAVGEGWSEDSHQIGWGVLIARTAVTSREPYDPSKHMCPECDYVETREVEKSLSFQEMQDVLTEVFEDAPMTMVPALIGHAVRLAMKAECFNGSEGLQRYVARIASEVEQ